MLLVLVHFFVTWGPEARIVVKRALEERIVRGAPERKLRLRYSSSIGDLTRVVKAVLVETASTRRIGTIRHGVTARVTGQHGDGSENTRQQLVEVSPLGPDGTVTSSGTS